VTYAQEVGILEGSVNAFTEDLVDTETNCFGRPSGPAIKVVDKEKRNISKEPDSRPGNRVKARQSDGRRSGIMADSHLYPDTRDEGEKTQTVAERAQGPAGGKKKKRLSMHEGVAVWCDCCSCEAEPYWVEVAEELGIDLGSDYEDEDVPASPQK